MLKLYLIEEDNMAKDEQCINKLLSKLAGADDQINSLSDRLQLIKKIVNEYCEMTEAEEVCPDVAESEKALVEAIENLYVQELLTREPEGDA